MDVVDLTQDGRAGELVAMMRRLSLISHPQQLLMEYARTTWAQDPPDLYVSLSCRDLPPGQYKVTRRIVPAELLAEPSSAAGLADPWRDWERLPVYTGGLLGQLIATPVPKIVRHLELHDDPALGPAIAGLRSCSAMPLFDRGRALNWAVYFSRDPEGVRPQAVIDQIVASNLMGATTRALVAINWAEELNRRLTRQLEQLARVQQSLLPQRTPTIPGLRIATSYLTSDQAGGDYYDFFPHRDGRWGMLIADVSGHGAAAAAVMSMLHAILHAYDGADQSPDSLLRYANAQLVHARLDGNFVTAFYATYDPADARLRYARAGHNPPRLKSGRNGAVRPLEGAATIPLGITGQFEATSADLRLERDDTLVLYTDGITEAFSPAGEMFGTEGLDAALATCSGDPDCTVDSVHAALYRHTGSRRRTDDQTLVALRYTGR